MCACASQTWEQQQLRGEIVELAHERRGGMHAVCEVPREVDIGSSACSGRNPTPNRCLLTPPSDPAKVGICGVLLEGLQHTCVAGVLRADFTTAKELAQAAESRLAPFQGPVLQQSFRYTRRLLLLLSILRTPPSQTEHAALAVIASVLC